MFNFEIIAIAWPTVCGKANTKAGMCHISFSDGSGYRMVRALDDHVWRFERWR